MNSPDSPDSPSSRSFWEARLRRFGHTGWAEAATYLYDQRLRLKAVGDVLAARPMTTRQHLALDYGCGVGDFTRLLAQRFEQIVGFDVSAQIIGRALQLNSAPNIRYTAQTADVFTDAAFDLILSITVLQHVTDDTDLQRLLDTMAAALAPGGAVLVLETFALREQVAGHTKRRTVDGLVMLFRNSGLHLKSDQAFYHPTEAPTPAFTRYRRQWRTRLLSRLAGWRVPGARRVLGQLAQRAAQHDTAYLDQTSSPTRLLVFERSLSVEHV